MWPQESEFFNKEEIYEVQFVDIFQELLRNDITLFLKMSEAGESKGREELIFCKICLLLKKITQMPLGRGGLHLKGVCVCSRQDFQASQVAQ